MTENENLYKIIKDKDNTVRNIIKRLENDNRKIKAILHEEYCDDYRKCRLKAYATKTREISGYIENEYFGREDKDE